MLSKPLLIKEMKSTYKLLLIFAAVLLLYIGCIVYMFDPELGSSLDMFAETMPEVMAAFGMVSIGSSLVEFMASYLYGFLLCIFPFVFELMLANRLVAKYVDRGSMAYLLATPNTRKKIITTQAFFLIAGIAVLILFAAALGIGCAAVMFPGELDIGKFLLINVGLFFLHVGLSGICFLASACSNDTKISYSVSTALFVAFYLLQMLSNMGGKLEKLKYATPFTLFTPADMIKDGASALLWPGILLAGGVICYVIGCMRFTKRDLSL